MHSLRQADKTHKNVCASGVVDQLNVGRQGSCFCQSTSSEEVAWPPLLQRHAAELRAVLGRHKLAMKPSLLAARDLVMLARYFCRAGVQPLLSFLAKVFIDLEACIYTAVLQCCCCGGAAAAGFLVRMLLAQASYLFACGF